MPIDDHIEGKPAALPSVSCNAASKDTMPPGDARRFIHATGRHTDFDSILATGAGIFCTEGHFYRRRWTTATVITTCQCSISDCQCEEPTGKYKSNQSGLHFDLLGCYRLWTKHRSSNSSRQDFFIFESAQAVLLMPPRRRHLTLLLGSALQQPVIECLVLPGNPRKIKLSFRALGGRKPHQSAFFFIPK